MSWRSLTSSPMADKLGCICKQIGILDMYMWNMFLSSSDSLQESSPQWPYKRIQTKKTWITYNICAGIKACATAYMDGIRTHTRKPTMCVDETLNMQKDNVGGRWNPITPVPVLVVCGRGRR